jgi:hypothetical protein
MHCTTANEGFQEKRFGKAGSGHEQLKEISSRQT